MPMGIVSDTDFNTELTKIGGDNVKKPEPKVEIVDSPSRGRGQGNVEVPDSLRKIIGETSKLEGREAAINLAADFGISPSSVSAYANGSTSTASYNEQPNLSHINQAKERISKKARNRLLQAIHHITSQKLKDASIKDLSGVARDMSAVVRNMEPDVPKVPVNTGPTFVLYKPEFRKEDSFDIVHVKE